MTGTGSADIQARALEDELRARNIIYDSATNVIWRMGVYDPVHEGWRFTNIGGRTVLSFIGSIAHLRPGSWALEIGSGLGDTARYLSQRFGCTVVGVDMNESQISHARQMADAAGMANRLVFLQASIEDPPTVDKLQTLIPSNGVQLVYTLDVLMLTANPGAVIKNAAELLCPDGWLALAEVTSGPAMTEDLRAHLWKTDGMRSLLTPTEYAVLIREAGFDQLRVVDRTPLAVGCFEVMASAFAQKRSEIIEAAGSHQYQDWRDVTDLYLRCFRDGELLYTQMLAT